MLFLTGTRPGAGGVLSLYHFVKESSAEWQSVEEPAWELAASPNGDYLALLQRGGEIRGDEKVGWLRKSAHKRHWLGFRNHSHCC